MNPANIVVNAPDLERNLHNLNAVDAQQLNDIVPGIGDILARRIIEYRNGLVNQQFQNINQLAAVDWISTKRRNLINQYCFVLYQPPATSSVDDLAANFNQLTLQPDGRVTISWPNGTPSPQ